MARGYRRRGNDARAICDECWGTGHREREGINLREHANLDAANKRIKYLEGLNESIEISYQEHCKKLQARIDELESECERLCDDQKDTISMWNKDKARIDALEEKLKHQEHRYTLLEHRYSSAFIENHKESLKSFIGSVKVDSVSVEDIDPVDIAELITILTGDEPVVVEINAGCNSDELREFIRHLQTSIDAAGKWTEYLKTQFDPEEKFSRLSVLFWIEDMFKILNDNEPTKHLAVCRATAAISIAGGYEHFGVYGNPDTGEIHFPRGLTDEPTKDDVEGKDGADDKERS